MRYSNIELIRIIAISFILLEHIIVFTLNPVGFPINQPHYVLDDTLSKGLVSLCIIGVNLFVLISGYFGISLRIKKLASLYRCCLFYASICLLANYVMGNSITIKSLFKVIFCFDDGWFMPNYIALMLFSPILNVYLKESSIKGIIVTTISMLFIDVYQCYMRELCGNEYGFNILHFITIYFVGALIKRLVNNHLNTGLLLFLYFISCIGIFIMGILKGGYFAYSYNSPFVLLSSIFFFIIVIQSYSHNSTKINNIAKLAFPIFLTNPLLPSFLNKYSMGEGQMSQIVLFTLLYLGLIYMIEQVRQRLDKLISSNTDSILIKLDKKVFE